MRVAPFDPDEYAALAVRWWRWAVSLPKASHPLASTGDHGREQSGPVYFLGGAWESGSLRRECVVPAGKSIFFPVVNALVHNIDEDPPLSPEQLRERASRLGSSAKDLHVEVHGESLAGVGAYRVQSEVFSFDYVGGSVLGNAQPGSSIGVTDGYYIKIDSLTPGKHILRFRGAFDREAVSQDATSDFQLDVEYHLLIAQGSSDATR